MEFYTYKQLSEISNTPVSTLATRASRMKIKGAWGVKNILYFNKLQGEQIINFNDFDIKNHPQKIDIVEMFVSRYGIKNIVKKLLISEETILKYTKEYKQTGFLIVESKINLNHIEL